MAAESWKKRHEKKTHLWPVCRIEIPNHPTSISIHEKSEGHIQMKDEILANGGRRPKSHTLAAFKKVEDYDNEIKKIEEAAAQSFLTNDNKFNNSSMGDQLRSFLGTRNTVDNLGYTKPGEDDNNFSIEQIKNDPGNFSKHNLFI